MTPFGFFSIVRKPEDVGRGTLTVRARVKSDLEALRRYLPSLSEIAENAGTDYRFRSKAPDSELASALAQIVQKIDYDNFKDEVEKKQGKDRAKVYGRVWGALNDLQR